MKFEDLLSAVPNARVVKGFQGGRHDDLRTWGVVCDIAGNAPTIRAKAEELGITWLGGNSYAFMNGLTIDDFKTYRVNGDLELMPEEEI